MLLYLRSWFYKLLCSPILELVLVPHEVVVEDGWQRLSRSNVALRISIEILPSIIAWSLMVISRILLLRLICQISGGMSTMEMIADAVLAELRFAVWLIRERILWVRSGTPVGCNGF